MKLDSAQVRHYFAPPAKSYWQWRDGGSVATWEDGNTIAFREELDRVLAALAPEGLPPLGSVLLLLAACRGNWEVHPIRRTVLHAHLGLLYGANYADLLTEVLTGLGKVHAVRAQLRARPDYIAALALLTFRSAPGRYSPAHSAELLKLFRDGLAEEEMEWKPQSALDDLLHDLGCLRWGLKYFDAERLELSLETGLDDAPQPAPLAPPPSSARSLIGELADDPELGAVARLARLLMAAVQLPRALSDPDELPIGGISDIVNRGPLDRLLLSELANDDLALSVRVAMNEALYLRRESPPRTPPRQRTVLLDAGLRTWGVPRVFITAVGLALAAKSEPQREVSIYRSEADSAVLIDFNSRAGLVDHLAALDHRLHPAAALSDLGRDDGDDEEEGDLILVTTADTLDHPPFQRALYDAGERPLYLAAVDREGRFQLLLRGKRGTKLISEARFDLDDVFAARSTLKRKLLDPSRDPQLPAIFAEKQFPLRLSCQVDVERSWFVHNSTVLSYTRDGRLLLWNGQQLGGRQIAEGLPEGALLWCSSAWEDDTVRLVLGKKSQRGLRGVTYSRRTGEVNVATLQLSSQQPLSVVGSGNLAFVFDGSPAYDVVRLSDGELLHSARRPPDMVTGTLYFRRPPQPISGPLNSQWLELFYDPQAPIGVVGTLPVFSETDKVRLIAMCDLVRDEGEGPLGITSDGGVLDPATGVVRSYRSHPLPPALSKIQAPFFFEQMSRDGQQARLRCFASPGNARAVSVLLDIVNAQIRQYSDSPWGLEGHIQNVAHSKVLRSRFSAIGALKNGDLVLIGRRGQRWTIAFDPRHGTLRLVLVEQSPSHHDTTMRVQASFETVEGFDRGYKLSVAKFDDGSRAWLDSRGLLHLASSDTSVLEGTIVLTDGPLAGWLADGRVFGPQYWHDGQDASSASVVKLDCLDRFAANLK